MTCGIQTAVQFIGKVNTNTTVLGCNTLGGITLGKWATALFLIGYKIQQERISLLNIRLTCIVGNQNITC